MPLPVEISFDDFAPPIGQTSQSFEQPRAGGVYEALRNAYGDMLTVYDLAELLHCSTRTAYSHCSKGVIPSVRIERRLYVPAVLLAQQIEEGLLGGGSDA